MLLCIKLHLNRQHFHLLCTSTHFTTLIQYCNELHCSGHQGRYTAGMHWEPLGDTTGQGNNTDQQLALLGIFKAVVLVYSGRCREQPSVMYCPYGRFRFCLHRLHVVAGHQVCALLHMLNRDKSLLEVCA